MKSAEEIRKHFHEQYPLVFWDRSVSYESQLHEHQTALFSALSEISKPILTERTVHFQTMLLFWSVVLIALKLFAIEHISLPVITEPVKVVTRVYCAGAVFLVAVALVFFAKARVDRRRSSVVWTSVKAKLDERGHLVENLMSRCQIQMHFWMLVVAEYNNAQKRYEKRYAERFDSRVRPTTECPLAPSIDITRLETVGWAREIQTSRTATEGIIASLKADSQTALDRANSVPDGSDSRSSFREAYGDRFGQWQTAIDMLSGELGSFELEKILRESRELQQAVRNAMERRGYEWTVEVFMPMAFASGTVMYLIFSGFLVFLEARVSLPAT